MCLLVLLNYIVRICPFQIKTLSLFVVVAEGADVLALPLELLSSFPPSLFLGLANRTQPPPRDSEILM